MRILFSYCFRMLVYQGIGNSLDESFCSSVLSPTADVSSRWADVSTIDSIRLAPGEIFTDPGDRIQKFEEEETRKFERRTLVNSANKSSGHMVPCSSSGPLSAEDSVSREAAEFSPDAVCSSVQRRLRPQTPPDASCQKNFEAF